MENSKHHHSTSSCNRQQEIEDCLFKNMLTKPYDSINVADLSRQLGISRKTFYSYFSSKDDCLCAIINRVTRNAILHTNTALLDDPDPLKSTIIFLDYLKDQRQFWDLIVQNKLLDHFFEQTFSHFLLEEQGFLDYLDTPEVKSDPYIMNCYLSCLLSLVLQWHRNGFDTPTEEIARKYLRIMHAPMIYPRNNKP